MLYEKPQKMALFRSKDSFVVSNPYFLGSKFEYYLTKRRMILYGGMNSSSFFSIKTSVPQKNSIIL